ncbi:MAG: hypothetical protein HYR63_28250 [Proteobacteria bacterium]|nr:hypothetical protein [Pseudomonadota bacterium]MBI3499049.1 hypothetical protein [Pseudomonadota bacterium]
MRPSAALSWLQHQWRQYRAGAIDQRIVGAGLTLATLSLLAKAVGLAREVVAAALFGTGDAIDAYVIATLVPVSLTGILCGAFQFAFIPAYRRALDRSGEAAAERLLAGASAVAFSLLVLATLAMVATAPFYLPWLTSGFDGPKRLLTESLLRWMAPYVVINGVGYIWAGVLVARRSFALTALVPATTPVVMTVLLLAEGRELGVLALVLGALAGMVIEAVLLGAGLRRQGVGLVPRWSAVGPELAAVGREYAVMLAASLLMGGSLLIDQAMAASLDAGSVASIGYASKLVAAVLHLATLALGSAAAPYYAGLADEAGAALIHRVRRHLLWVVAAAMPVTLVLILLSEPAARLMFERGAFTAESTSQVAAVQAAYFAQLPAFAATVLLVRLAASLSLARLILAMAALNLALKLALNYWLMQKLGAVGIAAATLPATAICAGFLYGCMRRTERPDAAPEIA